MGYLKVNSSGFEPFKMYTHLYIYWFSSSSHFLNTHTVTNTYTHLYTRIYIHTHTKFTHTHTFTHTIIIIIIIPIALKGAVRDFYNLPTAPRTVSSMHALVQSCANHVQHIKCLSCATCRVPCGTKGQLSYQVWQSWNHIYLIFILLAESIENRR